MADETAPMRPLNYEVMYAVEDEHWWFVGRRAIVTAQIADALSSEKAHRRVLDIGCGTGANLDSLSAFGAVQGVDLSPLALGYCRRRGHTRTIAANATALPFPAESFDLVTALDVIEHLDDDLAGLREMRRVLRSGAPAIIFVPAFSSLWGPNDEQSGHRRRYRLPALRARIEEAGLRVERISYANAAMFLPIWVGRKLLNLFGRSGQAENRLNHRLINGALARIFSAEAVWLRRHRLPFGVSIVCAARKVDP
jgi:SAM-dependent methyltransferase